MRAPAARDDRPSFVTIHAVERLRDRHNAAFSRAQWNEIALSIIDGRALLLSREGQSELYLCATPAGQMRLAWRPRTATIVTVLDDDHGNYRIGEWLPGRMLGANHSADDTRRRREDREWRRILRNPEAAE